jgi:leucyl/phenylalanyl-tRNA---protein transferase
MAYARGYFPFPHSETGEILWLRPDPRAIIPLDGFHVSRSFRRSLKKVPFRVTFDQTFEAVMQGCAAREDTWINEEFFLAYLKMFSRGFAPSVEVWLEQELVGGTYGVAVGGAFFAESKFHRVTDASKVALYSLVEHLKQRGFLLLEVQFLTPHLTTLGAIEIADKDYQKVLKEATALEVSF